MSSILQNNNTPDVHVPDCVFAMFGPPSQVGCVCNPQSAAQLEAIQELDLMDAISAIPLEVFQLAPALPSPQEIEQMLIPDSIPLDTPPLLSPIISPSASSRSEPIHYINIPDTPELVATPVFSPSVQTPIPDQIKWEDIPDKVYEDALAEMLLNVFRPDNSASRSLPADESGPITGRTLLKLIPEQVLQAAVVDILADVVQRKAPALAGSKSVEYIEVLDSPKLAAAPRSTRALPTQSSFPRPAPTSSGRAHYIVPAPKISAEIPFSTPLSSGPIASSSTSGPVNPTHSARQPEPRRDTQRSVAGPNANVQLPRYLVGKSMAGTKRKASPAPEERARPPQKRTRTTMPTVPVVSAQRPVASLPQQSIHIQVPRQSISTPFPQQSAPIPLLENAGAGGWQVPYSQPNMSFAYPVPAPMPAYDLLPAPAHIPGLPSVPSWSSGFPADFYWQSGVSYQQTAAAGC